MTKINGKAVAVTGAAGFIGSNLCEELLKRNCSVVGIDNLSQGNMRNVEGFIGNKGFRFVNADVRNENAIADACMGAEIIFHLAAYKIPRYGGALNTLMVNALGTKNVLEAARRQGQRVVFASTSDVYGKNPKLPFSEDSDFVIGQSNVPRWAYASSKIFDEQMCNAYAQEYGLKATILRYFGGYGPRQHLNWYGGPQGVFINCILQGKPIPLHGDGRQTRTFTYVSDQVRGTILAAEADKAVGEAFNIGSAREISIKELGALIYKLMNGKGKPKFEIIPYKKFGKYEDVRRRVPDTRKAKKILGFEAKVSLEDGLKKTITWQKEQPAGEGKGKLE